jgi:DNA-binding transcriptional MerR regulator
MPDETDPGLNSSELQETREETFETVMEAWKQLGEELQQLEHTPRPGPSEFEKILSVTELLLTAIQRLAENHGFTCRRSSDPLQDDLQRPIQEKPFYKIGEVCEIIDREPYVLRYWEAEFKILKPSRTRARQRIYSVKDLEILKEIDRLDREEKLTIYGIKKRLKESFSRSSRKRIRQPSGSRRLPELEIVIPDRQYFKLGEVSEILDVEPYVLRYWESEFQVVKPTGFRARHRIYHKKDIENFWLIKHLIYDEKYLISGVHKILKDTEEKELKDNVDRSPGAQMVSERNKITGDPPQE